MSKVKRSLIVKGRYFTVECAMASDGTQPAREFFDLLKEGMWPDDPDSVDIPDDEQITDYYRILAIVKQLATHGEPARTRDVNYLRDGIWEIKVARKRLTFYDTDGAGGYVPKPRITHMDASPSPQSPAWWFPEMDPIVRLGTYFPKLSQKTDEVDMAEALKLREEDLEHDR